jgi:hypothetical protein
MMISRAELTQLKIELTALDRDEIGKLWQWLGERRVYACLAKPQSATELTETLRLANARRLRLSFWRWFAGKPHSAPYDDAERLRWSLWHWLDQRRAALNPPMDRRSVRAREHTAKIAGAV